MYPTNDSRTKSLYTLTAGVRRSSGEAHESVLQATSLHPTATGCQRFGRLLLEVLCE
jgi:hypothetical protein